MIDKIKGLRKYTDCSMPSNEQQRIEKAECAAYNQAIEDVVKLFAIHNVSDMLCGYFDLDNSTSSATKCKCGREKWEHPKPCN